MTSPPPDPAPGTRLTTIIPVYNGARYIRATLESIASQTLRPDRVIVLDDGSTDDTVTIAQSFSGLSCEVIQNETNIGLFRNFNRALEFATQTEYLHYICADDLLLPKFMEQMLGALENSPAPSFGFCRSEFVNEQGEQIGEPARPGGEPRPVSAHSLLTRHSECDSLMLGGVVIKSAFHPLPVQFETDLPQAADCVFYSDLAVACRERIETPQVLIQIRKHPHSATKRNEESIQSWVMDEWRAIEHAANLMTEFSLLHWIRMQKLRCMFAARSHVKIQQMASERPEYALKIREATLPQVGLHHWCLGRIAVCFRDLIFGSSLERNK